MMAKTFNNEQQIVFNFLKSNSNEENLLTNLVEVDEAFQSISDEVISAYESLSKMQFVEVIYKISEALILKSRTN